MYGSDHRPVKLDLDFQDLVKQDEKPQGEDIYTDLNNTNKVGLISANFMMVEDLNLERLNELVKFNGFESEHMRLRI